MVLTCKDHKLRIQFHSRLAMIMGLQWIGDGISPAIQVADDEKINGKGSIETQRFICGIYGNWGTHRALVLWVEVLPRSCWNYCRNLRCLPSLQGSSADSQRDRCKSGMLSPCHWLGVSALCSGF